MKNLIFGKTRFSPNFLRNFSFVEKMRVQFTYTAYLCGDVSILRDNFQNDEGELAEVIIHQFSNFEHPSTVLGRKVNFMINSYDGDESNYIETGIDCHTENGETYETLKVTIFQNIDIDIPEFNSLSTKERMDLLIEIGMSPSVINIPSMIGDYMTIEVKLSGICAEICGERAPKGYPPESYVAQSFNQYDFGEVNLLHAVEVKSVDY